MKQLTNDVITPLNWGKKIEAVRNRLGIHQIDLCIEAGISPYNLPKNKKGRGSRHDSLLRLLACLRRAMTEEEFREFWMGLVKG